jgi:hypothetical protein
VGDGKREAIAREMGDDKECSRGVDGRERGEKCRCLSVETKAKAWIRSSLLLRRPRVSRHGTKIQME